MSIPPSPAIAPQTSSFPSHHPGQARRVPREDRQGQAWEGLKFCQTHLSEEAPSGGRQCIRSQAPGCCCLVRAHLTISLCLTHAHYPGGGGGAETEVALDPRERQHSRDPPVQTFHSRCGNGSPGREVNCSRPYNDFIYVFFLINPAINNKTIKIY